MDAFGPQTMHMNSWLATKIHALLGLGAITA